MNKDINGVPANSLRITAEGCCGCHTSKLNTFDYLNDLPINNYSEGFVEVQFKNTRKGYFLNSLKLDLHKGDMVAVESSPGHDIGQVTLTGNLVERQMRKIRYRHPNDEPRRVYRHAKPSDLEKYEEVKALEEETMIRSRKIAESLGLDMKIGDVEYQGDGQKAIFYYISEGRVDFRQLIKKLAEVFRIRVEMRQIGVRQEAGRIGGIGPCGRQLCCSGWISNFVSVGTNAARLQDLSLNPYKLAGQCGKLKCCLNYEVDTYFEAQHKIPSKSIDLQTKEGTFSFFKCDILAGTSSYLLRNNGRKISIEPIKITNERAFEIIDMNRKGEFPDTLLNNEILNILQEAPKSTLDILANESVTRFDEEKSKNYRRKNRKNRRKSQPQNTEQEKIQKVQQAASAGNRRRRNPTKNEGKQPQNPERKREARRNDNTKREKPRNARPRMSGQGRRPRNNKKRETKEE